MPSPGSRRELGIENLSLFGLDPVEHIHLAGDLGCEHVSLNLRSGANRLPAYPEYSLREDEGLGHAVVAAARARGVAVSLLEGFALAPGADPDAFAPDLDIAAQLGARAICVIAMDRDLPRSHAGFARVAELAATRGILTTTEVGAGAMRTFDRALAALDAVGRPDFQLLIDTMHFFRLGGTLDAFAAIDPAAIGHIQLCDVPMPAVIESYMDEALFERRAPGDGDLPLGDFLRHVPETVPIGLEVPIRSQVEAGLGPRERLGRCVAKARALFAAS